MMKMPKIIAEYRIASAKNFLIGWQRMVSLILSINSLKRKFPVKDKGEYAALPPAVQNKVLAVVFCFLTALLCIDSWACASSKQGVQELPGEILNTEEVESLSLKAEPEAKPELLEKSEPIAEPELVVLKTQEGSGDAKTAKAQTPTAKPVAQPKKPPEYTKADFMQDLQSALNKDGPDAALALFDTKLPAKLADDFDILFLKAAISVSAQKLDDAQVLCDKLLAREPDNQDVASLALAIAKMKGDKAAVKKQVDSLIAKDKNNPAANVELGGGYYLKKNYKQAKTHYKRALTREPENLDALQGLGQCDYYLENDAESEKSFKKILKLDPQNVQALLFLAKLAYANSEFKMASDYAKQALDLEPGNYEVNMEYGKAERYLGHYENAEKAWTAAIKIDPNYFLAYAYRAGVRDEQGNYSKAISDYKKVLKLNPKYYYAYESIGVLALHEHDWKTAREAFVKCIEFNSSNVSYPLLATYCYYQEGNAIEAKSFSDKILRKMDRNSIEYAMLRVYHDRAGEKPLPQKISALEDRNKQGKMYFYLGLFFDMFGGTEFANDYYTKVVNMQSPMFFEYRLAEWRLSGEWSFEKR